MKKYIHKFFFAISEKKLRLFLLCVGLTLMIERSYECLQKLQNSNLSVKMNMARSNETFAPSLTICPEYFSSYNKTNLNKIGIKNANDYRWGDWYGNSTLDGRKVFQSVTHSFSEIVETLIVYFDTGGKTIYSGSFEHLDIREKGHFTFGRCFEIHFLNKSHSAQSIDIKFFKSLYIFFNMPNQFYNDDSKSKLVANVGEKLFLDITYEILKNNFGKTCKSYRNNSYDSCKATEIKRRLLKKFNFTVPFLTSSKHKLCSTKEISREASKYFIELIYTEIERCASPCTNMVTIFGFPSYNKVDEEKGFVRLYFKSIIKVTEDFVSYDLLR